MGGILLKGREEMAVTAPARFDHGIGRRMKRRRKLWSKICITAVAGGAERLRKYDMIFDLLHAVKVHSDWQQPSSGLVHDFLHVDDWNSREYDPVSWVFENAWHQNVEPKWDPFAAVLNAEAPTARYTHFLVTGPTLNPRNRISISGCSPLH